MQHRREREGRVAKSQQHPPREREKEKERENKKAFPFVAGHFVLSFLKRKSGACSLAAAAVAGPLPTQSSSSSSFAQSYLCLFGRLPTRRQPHTHTHVRLRRYLHTAADAATAVATSLQLRPSFSLSFSLSFSSRSRWKSCGVQSNLNAFILAGATGERERRERGNMGKMLLLMLDHEAGHTFGIWMDKRRMNRLNTSGWGITLWAGRRLGGPVHCSLARLPIVSKLF